MTRSALRFWLLILTLSVSAAAGPILTLTPTGGAISGLLGGSPTWIIAVTEDGGFPVLNNVDYVTLVPVGTFGFSFINDWSVLGTYDIDPFAVPGALSTGTIIVSYDLFSVDPTDPEFNPELDLIGSNQLSANASVQVEEAAVPEPAYGALVGFLLAGLLAGRTAGNRRRTS